MRRRLLAALRGARDSFWLVPACLVALAVLLAEGVVNIDERVESSVLRDLGWVYGGSAEGARTMLGAVASSVIGVAGTTFAVTIAALSLASSQMGPRLLEHFTRDRGNRVTLGTFLATFTYALLVLRTVRGGDDSPFVPHLAVTIGLALALVSLGVLIYFIHHIAQSINVGTVIRLVSRELDVIIDAQFPERGATPELPGPLEAPTALVAVHAERGGYLQGIDVDTVARASTSHGGFVRFTVRPGDFVMTGQVVAHGDERTASNAARALALGPRRTSKQDVEFAVRQLVEVAVRALSPGINDPFTAIEVLDHLGAALWRLVDRDVPPERRTVRGRVRVVVPATSYDGLADVMFHQIRQNGASHPAVMLRLLEVLTRVAERERHPERLRTLRRHADLAHVAATRATPDAADRRDLDERYRALRLALHHAHPGGHDAP